MSEELFSAMAQSIISGDVDGAANLARKAIQSGLDPIEAIKKGCVVGIQHVGSEYSCGNAFVPELIVAGAAMKSAMEILEAEIVQRGQQRELLGVVVLGTVAGDVHDIGKNLVGSMLSAYGFEVHDLGVDVPIVNFVEKARQVKADIVAVSALLTTTMIRQREVVTALKEAGIREDVKVLVGGAPVTGNWVNEIGADGYGEDAIGAVTVAKSLLGINKLVGVEHG